MFRFRLRRPSAGLVIALLALVLTMAGTATAASLITSKQIKDGTISAKDLSKKVRAQLAKAGSPGPAGAPGVAGAPGAQGPKGDAGTPATALWAVVADNGALARGSHVTSAASPFGTGTYEVIFDRNVSDCAFIGSLGGTTTDSADGQVSFTRRSTNANGVYVQTYDSAGNVIARPFHLAVFC